MTDRFRESQTQWRGRAAFTLLELIVVIGIIVLVASIALPSISSLMTSGGDSQAYNLLLGQLASARAHAMAVGRYTCLHVQRSDRPGQENNTFTTILEWDPAILSHDEFDAFNMSNWGVQFTQDSAAAYFHPASSGSDTVQAPAGTQWEDNEWAGFYVRVLSLSAPADELAAVYVISGNTPDQLTVTTPWVDDPVASDLIRIYKPLPFVPRKMPGTFAFGELTDEFVASGSFVDLDDAYLDDFTTFDVIFSPEGRIVKNVDGDLIRMEAHTGLFGTGAPDPDRGELWRRPTTLEPGVTALTLFDFAELRQIEEGQRETYLNERGQFLPINPYTGRLFPRK